MEWSVQELAEHAGITGRTLRHYDAIGLLRPDRVGANGYRWYGPEAVARLQRILLLRETGMPLATIAQVLAPPSSMDDEIDALDRHLESLHHEQALLRRRVAAVEHTLQMRREGRTPAMDIMLDGFNDRYESEVVQRWGQETFDLSNRWWHAQSISEQRQWKRDAQALLDRWRELDEGGTTPASPAAQEHAATHVAWFAQIPGTPTREANATTWAAMIRGMAHQYQTDPAFHETFGSAEAAALAAAALRIHVAGHG